MLLTADVKPPLLFFATLALFACASGCERPVRTGGLQSLRPLEHVRAVRVIESTLASRGVRIERNRRVRIAGARDIDCDVGIAGTRYCVEYVRGEERARLGSALPQRESPGALVMVAGTDQNAGASVLVFEDTDYLYEPDPDLAGPDHPTAGEVEDRLRRSVIDYVAWLRGRGAL